MLNFLKFKNILEKLVNSSYGRIFAVLSKRRETYVQYQLDQNTY